MPLEQRQIDKVNGFLEALGGEIFVIHRNIENLQALMRIHEEIEDIKSLGKLLRTTHDTTIEASEKIKAVTEFHKIYG